MRAFLHSDSSMCEMYLTTVNDGSCGSVMNTNCKGHRHTSQNASEELAQGEHTHCGVLSCIVLGPGLQSHLFRACVQFAACRVDHTLLWLHIHDLVSARAQGAMRN